MRGKQRSGFSLTQYLADRWEISAVAVLVIKWDLWWSENNPKSCWLALLASLHNQSKNCKLITFSFCYQNSFDSPFDGNYIVWCGNYIVSTRNKLSNSIKMGYHKCTLNRVTTTHSYSSTATILSLQVFNSITSISVSHIGVIISSHLFTSLKKFITLPMKINFKKFITSITGLVTLAIT